MHVDQTNAQVKVASEPCSVAKETLDHLATLVCPGSPQRRRHPPYEKRFEFDPSFCALDVTRTRSTNDVMRIEQHRLKEDNERTAVVSRDRDKEVIRAHSDLGQRV